MTSEIIPQRFDRWALLPATYLYVFMAQFGNLFRISAGEGVPGLATLVGLALILFGTFRVLRVLLGVSIYQLIAFLFAWIAISSLFSVDSLANAYRTLGMMFGYLMLSAVVCGSAITDIALRRLWVFIALGLGISSGLTIIDYLGVIDVPRNNDLGVVSRLGFEEVTQASGFFPRRSAMAAVFSISITGVLIAGLLARSYVEKFLFLGCGLAGTFCILLTHNRSGVLSALLALAGYVIFSRRLGLTKRMRVVVGGALATLLTVTIMYFYFPSHLDVYLKKLALFSPDADLEVSRSDYARIQLFIASIQSLVTHPAGHGFGAVYLPNYGYKAAHNIFTGLIWAAGFMFFIWLPAFLFLVRLNLRRLRRVIKPETRSPFIDATLCSLVAWVLNNMTHDSLATGTAWVVFGAAMGRLIVGMRAESVETRSRPKATLESL